MFLATQDKPFLAEGFGDKFEQVKSLGYDAFEIDGKVLMENHAQIERASLATGLPVKMVCGGYGGWIGDFDEQKRQAGLDDISEILRICGGMGIGGIVVPAAWGMFSLRLPPMVPLRSAEEDRKVLLDSLSRLDKVAGETGTRIYLEPLNRYENHMILLVEEAVSYIKEGGFNNVLVTADYFHMNIEEDVIEHTLDEFKDYIGHIHLASSQRLQPGIGHLDYTPGFETLHKNGYEGGFTVECKVQADDEMKAYANSAAYIRDMLAGVGFKA